jgi:hypothetical protein
MFFMLRDGLFSVGNREGKTRRREEERRRRLKGTPDQERKVNKVRFPWLFFIFLRYPF